ncbi:MAG TPA: S46 family peptidase [Saprospiraceae bacterium]|nr:S46 family peptidase [Saprospiraceae bacterium]
MQKRFFLLFLLALSCTAVSSQGMWIPSLLEKQNEKEMKALGLKLSADDIYAPAHSSIKDAICQFDGGCTGEMISPEGLLLTNHHCGFDAIQQLSTLENNFVENGYWAKDRTSELPAEGVTAMFVSRIEDVTLVVLQGVTDGMAERERQSQIDKNIASLKSSTKKEKWEDIEVRPFYNGNQYYMFVTQTFKDVRFVGAPPSSIGKFGADTDNWVWPRHTGDFSIFRVYADKDNHPAAYSKDNVPYRPGHFLPISLDGADEGDFSMVYGFPGATNEYLTEAAIRQTGEVLDPARVAIRDRALKVMDGYMRKDPAVKISYVARYASIANAWKKWLGEMQGLKTYKAFEKKAAYEAEFTKRIQQNPDWNTRYKNLLPRLRQLYKDIEPYALGRDYYLETMIRNNEILGTVSGLGSWINGYDPKNETEFVNKMGRVKAGLEGFYEDYHPQVDEAVLAAMMEMYGENARAEWGAADVKKMAGEAGGYAKLAKNIFEQSVFAQKSKIMTLLETKKPAEVAEALRNDPAFKLWDKLQGYYNTQIQGKLQELQPQINLLQRQYMAAQMEVFKEKKFFPDANSTLRLTYGKIKGFSPKDAIQYEFQTDLDGVMEKYIPGDYEFDVPQKLIDLWKAKDYGQYATADGRMPVACIGTNHTTGGNSGSPALDANGNLIGLNFDRVWEGTMSDLNYDPAICRNIMVDSRYILFIVDKYGGAGYLLNEMKLVKGKKKKKK